MAVRVSKLFTSVVDLGGYQLKEVTDKMQQTIALRLEGRKTRSVSVLVRFLAAFVQVWRV
jgi:hypothetical protein